MEHAPVGLETMPLDVSLNILSGIEFSDRVNLLKVSRQVNEIVRDAVCVGNRNSLDGIIIGLPRAGSTTVFWQLVDQSNIQLNNRLDQSYKISNIQEIDTSKQGLHFLRRISLGSEGRTAVLFHGSSKSPTNRHMYPYYGLTHAVLIVISAQMESDRSAFKKSLKQLLMPVFALCGHMNWIFVINKMDLVEYKETAFIEGVTIVTRICQSLSQNIMDKVSFIPVSGIQSHNLLFDNMSKNGNNDSYHVMPWYTGPSVLQKLNEISHTVQIPLYRFDTRTSSIAVMRYKPIENTRNLAKMPSTQRYMVYGYVTNGAIATDDTLFIQPNFYKLDTAKKPCPNYDRISVKVLSIKYFDKEQKEVFAGTFVGLIILFEYEKFVSTPKPRSVIQQMHNYFPVLNHLMMPAYHSLATTRKENSVSKIVADVIMVGTKNPHWDGKLKVGMTAGCYSYFTRVHCKITQIVSSTDREGQNMVDKPASIIKGQRAKIELFFSTPCKVRVYNGSNEGRILLVMYNTVVAMGVIKDLVDIYRY